MSDQSETPSILGWKPPVIYSLATDSYRIATQADVDELVAIANAYANLKRTVQDLFTGDSRTFESVRRRAVGEDSGT